ncbi:hypothetical protein SAMN05661012_03157 [Chitinophaga sancti]|uniref:Uncharacterized protein n=1 Tax=Chitinophaga sancti TaxID=1004 RepID=A0A1K1QWF5_9BACT|nr:hypothetical protein SAMN05661012_03157 [Chitinophaga sancti]
MKKNHSKKLQLGKLKISSLATDNQAKGNNNVKDAASNSSCGHICPTVCSINCV